METCEIQKVSSCLFFNHVQIYPGAVELMQVIEEFIHIVGLGMKDFHNAYLMTGNLGKNEFILTSYLLHVKHILPVLCLLLVSISTPSLI